MTGDVIESLEKELLHAEEYGDNLTLIAAQVSVEWKKLRDENERLKEELQAAEAKCAVYKEYLQRANDALDMEGVELDQNDFLEALRKIREDSGQAAKQTDDWISAEKKLPDAGEDVLLAYCERHAVGKLLPAFNGWYVLDYGYVGTGNHAVHHWMPLPPLPNEEKEEAGK